MNIKSKNSHSPLDKAVFGAINASIFGFVFSISLFNKNFEQFNYSFKNKLSFTFRNMLVLSTIYGTHQFIYEALDSKYKKNYDFYMKSLRNFFSSCIPLYLGYKVYSYKNKNIIIPSTLFFYCGVLMFVIDSLELKKK